MSRIIKSGLIQMSLPMTEGEGSIEEIKEAMVQKHIPLIEEAGRQGVQILCLQEIFNTPYFCPGQDKAWYASAESVPGPTTDRMAEYAKKYNMVMIVPVYEREQAGFLYNTAAVIDADGTYLGKYRKNHIPHTSGFWEKFFFKPGNMGYPVFQTKYAKVGVYICYDRHFMGCINRVGEEKPWNLGKFYGTSYHVDPRGQIIAQASEDNDELLVSEFDLDMIDEVRSTWQFFRDRRPETYEKLVEL
jgi:N-carbamoylputrescine amidase